LHPDSVDDVPIQIRNIDGLGPVKAEFQTAPFALARGVFFQGTSTGQRNIVLTLGLNPNFAVGQSIGALRQQVYRYFMPELGVTLTFFSPDIPDENAQIRSAYVESVEPNIFSQDPEMQVSIICPLPDFVGSDEHIIGPNDAADYITEVNYTGSVSNGFNYLEVHSTDVNYAGSIEVTNVNGPFNQDLAVNGIFISPDQFLRLITVPTRRRVQLVDEATGDLIRSAMASMYKGSSWPVFLPGTNQLTVKADYVGPQWTLSYFNRYGGL
jgi:hypothetical protein